MKQYQILLTAWLLCCAVQPLMNAMAEETQMENLSLMMVIDETPVQVEWEANASVDALKALAQEAPIAQFWSARQYVGTGIQQAVDDRRPAGVNLVIQVGHGDGFQAVPLTFFRIYGLSVDIESAIGYTNIVIGE